MKKNYVSIILPTYNREKVIKMAIDSILQQTYPYFELLIVDDGSTDNTEALVREISDERIRYIKMPINKGPAAARNYGIEKSQYDYIAFHDSDDEWMSQKLEQQIRLLTEDIGMVYCSFQYVKGGYSSIIPDNSIPKEKLCGSIFNSLLESNKIGTPTILIKKECLESVGGFNEELQCIEDWELVIRVSEKYKIAFIEEPLVKVNHSYDGVNQRIEEKLVSLLYLMKMYEGFYESKYVYANTILDCVLMLDAEKLLNWKKKLVPYLFSSKETLDYAISLRKQIKKLEFDCEIQKQLMNKEKFRGFVERYLNGKKIAIYGLGNVGVSLLNLLECEDVEVVALIDKRKMMIRERKTIQPQDLLDLAIDRIVVTLPYQYENITSDLSKYINTDFVSIGEIARLEL